jgi:hypothetical protein
VIRSLEDAKIMEGTVVEMRASAERHAPHERPSIKDLPFYGIWKDRADVGDGVDFVNRLRDNPRG